MSLQPLPPERPDARENSPASSRAAEGNSLAEIQRSLLAARESRAEIIRYSLAQGEAQVSPPWSLLFLSTNVPGRDKHRPGLPHILERTARTIEMRWPARRVARTGIDALGPYEVHLIPQDSGEVKLEAVRIESRTPGGRLLDLDVYRADGTPVRRVELGIPERPCFACSQPARECILLRRHDPTSLIEAADSILWGALEHGSLGYPVA